jgi:hypothetical protein
MPSRTRTHADVANVLGFHNIVQRPHSLFDGSIGFKAMALILEIDMAQLKIFKTGFYGFEDMLHGEPTVVDESLLLLRASWDILQEVGSTHRSRLSLCEYPAALFKQIYRRYRAEMCEPKNPV